MHNQTFLHTFWEIINFWKFKNIYQLDMVDAVAVKKTLIRWFILELPMMIAGIIVVPIALLFCNKESTNLPKWARWWDEDRYGINGDFGWQNEHFPNGKHTSYYARLRWLFRNKIGVYTTEVIGLDINKIDINRLEIYGNKRTPDLHGSEGTQFCLIEGYLNDNTYVYSYFANIDYDSPLLNQKFYTRYYLGHKLMDLADIILIKDPEEKMKAWEERLADTTQDRYIKTVCAWHPLRRIKHQA